MQTIHDNKEATFETELPQIELPDVAIAEANQRQSCSVIPTPRNVVTRLMPGTPTTYKTPHKQSASWFREVYNGFMAAQFVMFAQHANDILKLIHSENLELQAGFGHVSGTRTPDDSQVPRKVAVWFLGEYNGHNSNDIDTTLDSFAVWANSKFGGERVINHIRMSTAFGVDAKHILEVTKNELVEQFPDLEINQTCILIRWYNGHCIQSAIRLVEKKYNPYELYSPLKALQDTVVRLSGVYDIPIASICMKIISQDKTKLNDFYHILSEVSNEFFNLLVGAPSITFSKETIEKNASRILQPTGCIVRVCNKALGKDGLINPSCFHGAVLGFSNKRQEACKFLEQYDEEGIRPPISKDEHLLGLHLCAVQAESMQLKNTVSLFGILGVSGNPIHAPGSWIWVARPAVRPLQIDLLNVFSLHPCSKVSLLPSRKELVPAFERFWIHTTDIFKMITDGANSKHSTVPRSKSPVTISELELNEKDAILLTLMGIDLKSKRTMLGDAYAAVSEFQNTSHLVSNIFQAMTSLGVQASLSDMFEYNQRAISKVRKFEDAKYDGDETFEKFAEVALDMSCNRKRKKPSTLSEPLCLSAERVRRILKACSLKSNIHLSIERGYGSIEQLGTTLQKIIFTSTSIPDEVLIPKLSVLLQKPLVRLFDRIAKPVSWLDHVEKAIAQAAAISMVSMAKTDCMLFMVVGTKNQNEVFIKTVQLDGSITNGSLDDMCKIAHPKVIILQQIDEDKVRVVATNDSE